MKFFLLTCLFYVFCRVSGQRSLQYSLLGKFYVQSQPSTTIYSRSEIFCAVACIGNDLCAFFSFSRDDDICMLYDQSWTANLPTVYNSSWSTYKTADRILFQQTDLSLLQFLPNHLNVLPTRLQMEVAGRIQRRQDGSVDFNRNWTEYERGFGSPESEYWIGLATLHNLTRDVNVTLRVDLTDFNGSTAYAVYDTFSIAGPEDNYRLNIGGYNGTAGDSLAYHNKMPFSTFDRNHDTCRPILEHYFNGAWWYNCGFESNLNGLYTPNLNKGAYGVIWGSWEYYYISLKRVEMKIKH